MSVSLQRNPTPLSAWHLVDSAAMVAALAELGAAGWVGSVALSPTVSGTAAWSISLASADGRTVSANVGDWLVLDGSLLTMSDADRAANYTE